jgi:dihydrofolate reductase
MRKVVLDTIMSLDGCYTDGKSQIDWFDFVDEDMTWSHDILTRAGTLVFGRTTYEDFTQVFPKMDAAKVGFDPYIVERLNTLPKVVFSKTLKDGSWSPVTIVHSDPAKELSRMKEDDGKDILLLGSGSIVAAAVRSGLVDEYRLRVEPIVLGTGKPLFLEPQERRKLKLVKAWTFPSGVLGLHYERVPT